MLELERDVDSLNFVLSRLCFNNVLGYRRTNQLDRLEGRRHFADRFLPSKWQTQDGECFHQDEDPPAGPPKAGQVRESAPLRGSVLQQTLASASSGIDYVTPCKGKGGKAKAGGKGGKVVRRIRCT